VPTVSAHFRSLWFVSIFRRGLKIEAIRQRQRLRLSLRFVLTGMVTLSRSDLDPRLSRGGTGPKYLGGAGPSPSLPFRGVHGNGEDWDPMGPMGFPWEWE